MSWKLDKSRPICPQIEEQICMLLAKGEFAPDEKLLSVREVAVAAGVNPNTVQKAFELLEQNGLIYSVRGSGWYAADSSEKAKELISRLVCEKTEKYFEELYALGFETEQIKQTVKEWDK